MQHCEGYVYDRMNRLERCAKRAADCVVAAVLLVVCSPLFLLCFFAVWIEDGRPVIFKQERIGLGGRPFCIYKLRSMRVGEEGEDATLCGEHSLERLTKTGKFLREHHLDELPQLWNVFIGDMAFVGPRPERKYFIDKIMEYDPRYECLYQIRPGVTSYATLYNGYTDTMEKMLRRLELDLYYLEHRSWLFDAKILLLTFGSIVSGKKF